MNSSISSTPWARSEQEVLSEFGVQFQTGLSPDEVRQRLQKYGANLLKTKRKSSKWTQFLTQFKSPVVIILLVATLISLSLGEFINAIAILVIVFVNAVIGYIQEVKAEAAVEALKKMSAPKGRVLRNGEIHEVAASEIVPGDILFLESGDFISADARLIEARQISTNEAVLTGESLPVEKHTEAIDISAVLADRKNMLFTGTAVATGTAKAIVTSTGDETELGKIANLLESTEKVKTPLQTRLEEVSRKLLWTCGAVVLLVAALGLYHQQSVLEVALTAISLAVAAIPEGLPAVVTLALALAIRRMTRKNAIVKDLPAVETLGSTSVICTDKTGTLTTGQMRVQAVFTPATGLVNEGEEKIPQDLIVSSILCSNAATNAQGGFSGDPTEIALLIMAQKSQFEMKEFLSRNVRLYEWSFDSDRKRMSVAQKQGEQLWIHCKGAPEAVLEVCNISDQERLAIERQVEELSAKGRRTLAVARKVLLKNVREFDAEKYRNWSDVEMDLEFVGLVAISDQPRQESIKAIADCKSAGIKVVMITGDHPVTAEAVAKELGILEDGFSGVISGPELETMSDQNLRDRVEKTAVYARVSPIHKLKIVRAWQALGHVVAMTGDGVNDAPALKQASIGVSMGRGGTEVARQASSMILTDDNFATIVSAVEEGRAIYGNIRRTIQYLLSGNLAEILIMFGAALIGWPSPLAPIHLLWINLVTDGLPSLALAAEPVPKNFLISVSRPSPEKFFDRRFYNEMVFIGVTISLISLFVYGQSLKTEGVLTARTHVFSFLVFVELFRSFACRSEIRTFFQVGPFSNRYHLVAVLIPIIFQISLHHIPAFQAVFKVGGLAWSECLDLIGLTLIPVTAIEVWKLIIANKEKRNSNPDLDVNTINKF